MSCNYADGLSEYEHKGVLGLPEIFDTLEDAREKIKQLSKMIKSSKHTVVITGAGISTSAGIPDFRGPNGVWTLEKKGEKPSINVTFDDAKPTLTHMALTSLARAGKLQFLISQNVDGLHLKSGVPMEILTELHGNMFIDKCNQCDRQFVRKKATSTVGQKPNGLQCPVPKPNGRRCRGKLHDTILDWEDELPSEGLNASDAHCKVADLVICLGSTLQILPCGTLPILTKKNGGKFVVCNLQKTKQDRWADLIIHYYADDVMKGVMENLGLEIIPYDVSIDPTKTKRDVPLVYPKLNVPQVDSGKKTVKRTSVKEEVEHSKVCKQEVVESENGSKITCIKKDDIASESFAERSTMGDVTESVDNHTNESITSASSVNEVSTQVNVKSENNVDCANDDIQSSVTCTDGTES